MISTEIERDWRDVTSRSTEASNFMYSNLYIQRHVSYRNKHIYWAKSMKTSQLMEPSILRKEFIWKEKELLVLSFKRVCLPSLWILWNTAYKILAHGNDGIYWCSVLTGTCSVNIWTIRQETWLKSYVRFDGQTTVAMNYLTKYLWNVLRWYSMEQN
jgi:hypothetical protein